MNIMPAQEQIGKIHDFCQIKKCIFASSYFIMNRYILIFYFLIGMLPFSRLVAQQSKPMRIEIPCSDDVRPFELVSLGSKGVLVYYKTEHPTAKNQFNWIFTFLDINLKMRWTKEQPLDEVFEYKTMFDEGRLLFLVFQNSGSRGKSDKMRIIRLNKLNGDLSVLEETIPEKSSIIKYLIQDSVSFTGLNTHDDKAIVHISSLKTGLSAYLRPELDNRSYLEDILLDSADKTITCLYEYFPVKRQSVFKINTYTSDNKLVKSLPVLDFSSSEKVINSVKIRRIDSNRTLLLGSYSNDKSKTVDEADDRTEESTGFFSCLIRVNKIDSCYFYNFLDFKKFFNKIRGNQAIYENGTNKKKEVSSNYRLLLHDIINSKGQFLFVAEAYYPEYHTVTNWTYDYYGHMIPNYYTIFDGYRYNNTFIAGFDSIGRLVWDNSFEINNILTFKLRKRVTTLFDGDQIIMAYNYDGKIASKVIKKDETIENISFSEIEFTDSRDRLVSDDNSDMNFWYNNYFLAFGYQKLKNSSRSSSRRDVFYINKVTYK